MGAFDFETNGLGGEVVFGTLQYEIAPRGNRSDIIDTYHADGMFDLLKACNSKNMRWFAHNLEYDAWDIIRAAKQRQKTGEVLNIIPCLRGLSKCPARYLRLIGFDSQF